MIIGSDKPLALIGFSNSITVKEIVFALKNDDPSRDITIIEPDELFQNPDNKFQYLNLAVRNDFVLRRQVSAFLDENKLDRFSAIHNSAVVYLEITKINPGVAIGPLTVLGFDVEVGTDVVIVGQTAIGHGSKIGDGTYISSSNCFGGSTKVGKNCYFGLRTTLYDKITICDEVTTSVASVVRKNITEPGIYHGSPAKKLRLKR